MLKKLLVYAGTTEGRNLAVEAAEMGYDVTVSVATDYGREIIPPHVGLTVVAGRTDAGEMHRRMTEGGYTRVIDATHPYAVEVSRNIGEACRRSGVEHVRLLRAESDRQPGCLYFDGLSEACAAAAERRGNILAATGSKEIGAYCIIGGYKERLYARVLPTAESVGKCRNAGIPADHILEGKGPFGLRENIRDLQLHDIKILVTKDGGPEGGFAEKIEAARLCGVTALVVQRPAESGFTYLQVLSMLKEGV